jgi:hypothetical protein
MVTHSVQGASGARHFPLHPSTCPRRGQARAASAGEVNALVIQSSPKSQVKTVGLLAAKNPEKSPRLRTHSLRPAVRKVKSRLGLPQQISEGNFSGTGRRKGVYYYNAASPEIRIKLADLPPLSSTKARKCFFAKQTQFSNQILCFFLDSSSYNPRKRPSIALFRDFCPGFLPKPARPLDGGGLARERLRYERPASIRREL